MTPYQAVFGREPTFGIQHFSILSELLGNLHTEEELLTSYKR